MFNEAHIFWKSLAPVLPDKDGVIQDKNGVDVPLAFSWYRAGFVQAHTNTNHGTHLDNQYFRLMNMAGYKMGASWRN